MRSQTHVRSSTDEANTIVESLTKEDSDESLLVTNFVQRYASLGRLWYRRFQRQNEVQDLEKVIQMLEKAFELMIPGIFDPAGLDDTEACEEILENRTPGGQVTTAYESSFTQQRIGHMRNLLRQISLEFLGLPNSEDNALLQLCVAIVLRNLVSCYLSRYQVTSSLEDLNSSISRMQLCLHTAPPTHESIPQWHQDLGHLLAVRFHTTDAESDMNKALTIFEKATLGTQPDHPMALSIQLNRTNLFIQRSEYYLAKSSFDAASSDLQQAILERQKGISLAQGKLGTEMISGLMFSTGRLCMRRSNLTRSDADLSDAVKMQEEGINLLSSYQPSHHNLPTWRTVLADTLWTRYQRMSQLSDLNKAILLYKSVIAATSDEGGDYPDRTGQLAVLLMHRFIRLGEIVDLDFALAAYREAIRTTLNTSAEALATHYTNLGSALTRLAQLRASIPDIEEAIHCQRKAIELCPEAAAVTRRACISTNLGNAMEYRYELTGNISDLDEAIASHRAAVTLTPIAQGQHSEMPDTSPLTPSNNLASALCLRYERSQRPEDLEEAILIQRDVVENTSPTHMDRPLRLINLGKYLTAQYHYKLSLKSLDEAIQAGQQAVNLTPHDHPDLPVWLTDLGRSVYYRREKLSSLSLPCQDDADKAVRILQRAANLYPADHHSLPNCLMILGNAQFHQARIQTARPLQMQSAFDAFDRAIALLPAGDGRLARFTSNLGAMLSLRSKLENNAAHLQESISMLRKAVDLTPETHMTYAYYLACLGEALELLSKSLGGADLDGTAALEEARIYFKKCALTLSGDPRVKLLSAVKWIFVPLPMSDAESMEATGTISSLLPVAAGLEHTLDRRHRVISYYQGLTSSMAALAFSQGQVEKGLEWLEHGRCLVWSQLNALRTPLDDLRIHDRELADRVAHISKSLESISMRAPALDSVDGTITELSTLPVSTSHALSIERSTHADSADMLKHAKLAREWREIVETVRLIPNFEDFLQPASTSKLFAGLADVSGPVVIINMHQMRCDALALISDGPSGSDRVLFREELTDFSYARAEELTQMLQEELASFGVGRYRSSETLTDTDTEDIRAVRPVKPRKARSQKSVLKDILAELWTCVVKPILDSFAFSPSEALENRIWFCPTGPLTFLPIHAAGIYDSSGDATTIFDYVIPSYIPTVSSLITAANSRHPSASVSTSAPLRPSVLVLSVPNSPGLPKIEGTIKEADTIQRIADKAGVPNVVQKGTDATVQSSLALMQDHSIVHFACHASQNKTDPLKSCFYLTDGQLSLSTVIAQHSRDATGSGSRTHDLAFLSACQTSTGSKSLSEEAVHLAAGMLAAGYRGVVATMWSIPDEYAPAIAEAFYESLFEEQSRTHDPNSIEETRAAQALVKSVRKLHNRLGYDKPNAFLAWVPYLHFGL